MHVHSLSCVRNGARCPIVEQTRRDGAARCRAHGLPSLNERLATRRCERRSGTLNPQFASAVDRLIGRLTESGGTSSPALGETMPPFVLPDERGNLVSLDDLIGRGRSRLPSIAGTGVPIAA